MEQYISKSALVAEIEKETKTLRQEIPSCENKEYKKGKLFGLQRALYLIDTLEVREVDLDLEIRRYRMNNPIIGHREESLHDYMANVAKHFFELGLKAQKGE